jgi:glycosyltransferase involved in cell wall biosynthesis
MKNIKVLIITYYWPPSGGAGVQRWVKLVKYLGKYNIEPHVLTVHEDSASYMQLDESLNKDISSNLKIYKTGSFEPLNFYSRLVGKKSVPTAGYSNVNYSSFKQKFVSAIRSNLFIPDPRRGWNRYAYKKAVEIIKNENIGLVITTSPPHSSQLIGLKLKNKLNIKWICDLRDPWTDIYYYNLLRHSFISKSLDKYFERKVLVNADNVLTVSNHLKNLFINKDSRIEPHKFHVVPNGFDKADFLNIKEIENKIFTICYTGTMSDEYNPVSFFNCLESVKSSFKEIEIRIQFVGKISDSLKQKINTTNLTVEFIPTVPHDKIGEYQKNANLLFLVIPEVQHAEGILTGKLFEYLATGNMIIGIGPPSGDAANIIKKCEAGVVYDRNDEHGIKSFLREQIINFIEGKSKNANWKEIDDFSREKQAGYLSEIIRSLLNVK